MNTIPPLLKLIWIKKITGLKNIPPDGRFIVTPNHQSYFDDWIVPSIIIPHLGKELHMYVNRRYFKNPFFRLYLNHHKSIPVEVHKSEDHREVNEKAFQKALYYLKNKEPICIYPEGHRSPDGELQPAKLGAARLALTAKVPVIPIGIIGSYKILPRGKIFPRLNRCTVNIGKPMFFDKYYGKKNNKKILIEVTTKIMKQIAQLTKQEYNY